MRCSSNTKLISVLKVLMTLLPFLLVIMLSTARTTLAVSPNLVISQVYGGGGNSGAPYLNDFIEIFNRGSTPINVNGWSVQYASATASSWSATLLPNISIAPGGYLLIEEASGGPNGAALPTPDVIGTINLASTAGKVALVNVATALAISNPVGLPQVVDFVGYGSTANAYEGTGPVPTLSATKSAIRNGNGCMDTDDNGVDFATSTPPTPRNSSALPNDCSNPPPPILTSPVWIVAFYYAGYLPDGSAQGDEAVELMNVSPSTVDISGWTISDFEGDSTFPAGTMLATGQRIWVARRSTDFQTIFGFKSQYEFEGSDAAVPNMSGTPPIFSDPGDEVALKDNTGGVRDAVVYGAGSTVITGWLGVAVQPYNVFPMNDPHQVIHRKLDERTGYPIADTHGESDWSVSRIAGAPLYGPVRAGDLFGKKPMAPGWHTGILNPTNAPTDDWITFKVTETASLSVLVGPDHLYDHYVTAINSAQRSIYIEGYTLQNPDIAAALSARAAAGITIKILLEGEPCCDDTSEMQFNLWAAKQIEDAAPGTQVWFMANLSTGAAHYDRYNNQHAKFTLIDVGYPTQLLLTGTENSNCSSMSPDYKGNGTAGNRGYYFKTNAPSVMAYYQRIFNLDLDTTQQDIVPYGVAPYVWDGVTTPVPCGDGISYTPVRRLPLNVSGTFPFEVVQCPDNCLHYDESLIGMVRQAGVGDVLLVEQAYERLHWGLTSSTVTQDPNPRLEAYIDAARRGASVRILLDAQYDSITSTVSNSMTVAYVNGFSPTLNIEARLVDAIGGVGPAGSGIHAKMVMLNQPSRSRALVHIGSINGSENSSKFNRELALQVQSTEAFCYIYDIFNYDWQYSGGGNLDGEGLRGNCPPFVPDPVLDKQMYLPLIRK